MKKGQIIDHRGTVASEGRGGKHEAVGQETRAESVDSCRCKEASAMSPKELLKLMIGDLTFWKKAGKK